MPGSDPSSSAHARPRGAGDRPDADLQDWAGYDIFMLVFSLIAIGMLVIGVAVELGPSSRSILAYADTVVCVVFLVDFVVSLARAENRWRYLVTWGWLDLISSIPAIDSARWGRGGRIVRVLRVIRGVRATHLIASMLFRQRALGAVLAGAFVSILMIFASSFAILAFEEAGGGNIKTADDAVWWAVCTVTTVGYGDLYPITWEGRVVAFFLMVTGASTFGTLAGVLAGWFIDVREESSQGDLAGVREELAALRKILEARDEPDRLTDPTRSKNPIDPAAARHPRTPAASPIDAARAA